MPALQGKRRLIDPASSGTLLIAIVASGQMRSLLPMCAVRQHWTRLYLSTPKSAPCQEVEALFAVCDDLDFVGAGFHSCSSHYFSSPGYAIGKRQFQ